MNGTNKPPYRSFLPILTLFITLWATHTTTAQTIENTSWKAYYALISDTVTVEIETDTFRANTSTGINILKSWIAVSNDSMWIADITGPSTICPTADTALYTYTIVNDSLDFTPIIDSCAQRLSVLDSTEIWREPQGPPLSLDETSLESIVFYPNPMIDVVNFNLSRPTKIDIFTVDGQLMRSVQLDRGSHRMRPGLASGIYVCHFESKGNLQQAVWIVQ